VAAGARSLDFCVLDRVLARLVIDMLAQRELPSTTSISLTS
jgi:hypothetical protein